VKRKRKNKGQPFAPQSSRTRTVGTWAYELPDQSTWRRARVVPSTPLTDQVVALVDGLAPWPPHPDEMTDLGQRLSLAALVWNGVRLYAGSELAALLEQVTKLWAEEIELEEGERPAEEVVRELERRALASVTADARLVVQIQVFERGGRCDIETKSAWIKSPR
jgi:hypothetical protein